MAAQEFSDGAEGVGAVAGAVEFVAGAFEDMKGHGAAGGEQRFDQRFRL